MLSVDMLWIAVNTQTRLQHGHVGLLTDQLEQVTTCVRPQDSRLGQQECECAQERTCKADTPGSWLTSVSRP